MTISHRRSVAVAIVVLVACLVFVAGHLLRSHSDPTIFIAVGEQSGEIRDFAEARLGKVLLRPDLGHDGRFFFVQAHDPWLLAPRENAEILDLPAYRSMRMAFPVIASAGGLIKSEGVVWGMLIVNVLAMGWGAFSCAELSQKFGGSPWWGLSFPLNIGLIAELTIGGAGVLAAAAAFSAVKFLVEERYTVSALLFGLTVLAREVMMISVAGTIIWLVANRRWRDAVVVGLPAFGAIVGWGAYVRMRLGEVGSVVGGSIDIPFRGLAASISNWISDPVELGVGVVVLMVLAGYVVRSTLEPSLLAWTFLPFCTLALVLSETVWTGYFNFTRAIAPVWTAYVLIAYSPSTEVKERLSKESPIRDMPFMLSHGHQ